MNFQFAKRADVFKEGIFSVLNEKKNQLQAKGQKIYNLSVGTPDFKPPRHIMEAVSKAALDPDNYKYSLTEMPELVKAMCDYYDSRFGVELLQDEVMAVYGSQEGIAHIGLALTDPGDIILVPDPGYPIFEIGPFLAGAKVEKYPLYKENGFLPDFNDIPEDIADKAKFIIVSYPLNPVCAVADDAFYKRLIDFAKAHHIIVIHDNAYSDIIFGGREGKSFLSYEGAKEIGVEFYSLSKSFNLTGARISFVVGNREIIKKFKMVRSQIDYGIFYPVQYAALAALTGPLDEVKAQCAAYEERNKALCSGLRSIGWHVPDSEGTMFVWAPIPENYTHSEKFVLDLMEMSGVICVPGTAFGQLGEGFVRFALVCDVDTIHELVRAIDACGILKSEDPEGIA